MVIWNSESLPENQANGIGYFSHGTGWVEGLECWLFPESQMAFKAAFSFRALHSLFICLHRPQYQKMIFPVRINLKISVSALLNCEHWPWEWRGSGSENKRFGAGSDIVVVCLCVSVKFSVSISPSHWIGCVVRAPCPPPYLCIVTYADWVTPLHQLPQSSKNTHKHTQSIQTGHSLSPCCHDH